MPSPITPLADRYDASKENRAKGAGFYQFSTDEETRKAQMEELKAARMETEKTRHDTGALDVKPGEIEGMQASGTSRAMEKRKRQLEERRKLIEAKRRKIQQPKDGGKPAAGSEAAAPLSPAAPPMPAVPADPFAALEAAAAVATQATTSKSQGKTKAAEPASDADAFLSRLEEEFLASKGTKRQGQNQ